jgi:uncharacterized Zn finger protein (UPF0148 family)
MIRFTCPTCRKALKIADHCAGGKVACPRCGQRLQVPAAPAPRVRVRDRTILGESLPASPAPPDDEGDQAAETSATRRRTAKRRRSRLREYEEDAEASSKARGIPLWVKVRGIPDWAWVVLGVALCLLLLVGGTAVEKALMPEMGLPPGDMPLKAFYLQKPAGPTAVQVDCELDTYYNYAFRHCEETHFSFELIDFSLPYGSAHVYAPKTSEHGRRLYELLKDGSKRRLTLRIQRVGPDGEALPAKDDRDFALIGIVK